MYQPTQKEIFQIEYYALAGYPYDDDLRGIVGVAVARACLKYVEGRGKFVPLAVTMAKRALIDDYRHRCGRKGQKAALDAPGALYDDTDDAPHHQVRDPAPTPEAALVARDAVEYVLAKVSRRESHVLRGAYLEFRSNEELAKTLGISETRVSQIRSEGLRKARRALAAV